MVNNVFFVGVLVVMKELLQLAFYIRHQTGFFTQLRHDIEIFSNVLRKVILIELICPCEENMESWHSTKINKYLALKATIESNGWSVEIFAVEVGARGYCSKSAV